MARGYCLAIGLNAVNPRYYGGRRMQLYACENDANNIADYAKSIGFKSKAILTECATGKRVMAAIKAAADWCEPGDTFLFWNSSHGTLVPDRDADEQRDNAVVMFDRLLIDDEFVPLWTAFKPGVKIVTGFDCCHSATAARLMCEEQSVPRERMKAAPRDAIDAYWRRYGPVRHPRLPIAKTLEESGVEILGIEACTKDQTALDGDSNGAHTGAFLRAVSEADDYYDLRERIEADLKSRNIFTQTPKLTLYTASDAFARSKPLGLG